MGVEVHIGIVGLAILDGDKGDGHVVVLDVVDEVVEAEAVDAVVELHLGVDVRLAAEVIVAVGAVVLGDIEAVCTVAGVCNSVADYPLVVALADVEPLKGGVAGLKAVGLVGDRLGGVAAVEDCAEGHVLGDGDVAVGRHGEAPRPQRYPW